jgi:uncharacterized protein (DUF2267 family)
MTADFMPSTITVAVANVWLDAVMERMNTDDVHLATSALRNTLHALQDRVGIANAIDLGAQLPTLLRGVHYEGFEPEKPQSRERSKAAFFAHIEGDTRTGATFDAEAAARAVFDVIWEKVDPGEVTKLIRALPSELRELWPGVACMEAEEEEQVEREAGVG